MLPHQKRTNSMTKQVTTKKTTVPASARPIALARTPEENVALLDRIAEITAETLAHPQVVNKTDEGVASRVARILNKEGIFGCTAHRHWTGAHVLMVSIGMPAKK